MEIILMDGKTVKKDGTPVIVPHGVETWLKCNQKSVAFVKYDNVFEGVEVKNGNCFTNTGFRKIVFDKSGKVKPVVRKYIKGPQAERCTSQAFEKDDFLLLVEWGHGEDGLTIFEKSDPDCPKFPYNFRFLLDEPVYEFLSIHSRGESFVTFAKSVFNEVKQKKEDTK
jgi:hypothetical protein